MKKKSSTLLISFCLLTLLGACGRQEDSGEERQLLGIIEETWMLCETDLSAAQARAEELADSVGGASEYVRQKYDMLAIRLRDKSDIVPSTPDSALRVQQYFARRGNAIDKERSCYYAGSAYRDLKDYPQAVSYFLMAVDAARQGEDADTLLWQNALSQLGHLYILLLDYEAELKVAWQSMELAKATRTNLAFYQADVATAYQNLNDTLHCLRYLDEAHRTIRREHYHPKYGRTLAYMLSAYARLGRLGTVDTLLQKLSQLPEEQRPHNYELSLALCHEKALRTDSAILCYTSCYNKEEDITGRYEAAAGLQRCYLRRGDFRQAALWGSRLYDTNDSVIAQRAFEQTERARDTYVYFRNKEEEQNLRQKAEAIARRNRRLVFFSATTSLALLCTVLGGMAFYSFRRRHYTEELVDKDRMLRSAEKEIQKRSDELMQRRKINQELTQLALMNGTTDEAEEVIELFQKVAAGQAELKQDSWRKLMGAVETLHPGFHDAVQGRLQGHLREPLIRTICLMKIGLEPAQVARVMNAKIQTVWNRFKRAESTCGDLLGPA
ncbi:MAG: hypothetical protein IJ615_01945 [Bacteroidaceae bacterium]|nr:hypothetical protein [Bacteroidaceae bacterium]